MQITLNRIWMNFMIRNTFQICLPCYLQSLDFVLCYRRVPKRSIEKSFLKEKVSVKFVIATCQYIYPCVILGIFIVPLIGNILLIGRDISSHLRNVCNRQGYGLGLQGYPYQAKLGVHREA